MANDSEAEIFIRLHANSMENSSVYGALGMCMTAQNPYNAELHDQSYRLAKSIIDNNTLTVAYLSDDEYRRRYELDLVSYSDFGIEGMVYIALLMGGIIFESHYLHKKCLRKSA